MNSPPNAQLQCRQHLAPPVIRFGGVHHVFEDTSSEQSIAALQDMAFEVHRHEFVAVLGPSGCGKSTLLRLVAGLLSPSAGRVEVYGMAVTEPRDDIAIVFQRPVLLPWFDVLGNVTFPMRHKNGRVTATERERAVDLLDLVGLKGFEARQVSQLSGGMQQRVSIARALLMDPDILLMDEPFSALDALTRDEMMIELMRILAKRPKSVLFVTHSIPEAVLLSDRIVVMTPRPGRVREILSISLPRPRSFATQSDPLFIEAVNEIRSHFFTARNFC